MHYLFLNLELYWCQDWCVLWYCFQGDDGMARHDKNQCICPGSVLKWTTTKYQKDLGMNSIKSTFHKANYVSWASPIFPTFSTYSEQSCLVIVPAAKFCLFFLQSFVFRIESLYRTTSTAVHGILAHEGIKCWKEKGLYLNMLFVVVQVLWETVFWSIVPHSWTLT